MPPFPHALHDTIMPMPSSKPDTTLRAANLDTQEADRRLHAQVMERLSQTSLRWLDIQVHVQQGLVKLCGSLRDARLRAHAEWLVFTTDGVHAGAATGAVAHRKSRQRRHTPRWADLTDAAPRNPRPLLLALPALSPDGFGRVFRRSPRAAALFFGRIDQVPPTKGLVRRSSPKVDSGP